jgi:capsular polysaccharide biosynthesis protein
MLRNIGQALRRVVTRAMPWWGLVVVAAVVGVVVGHVIAPTLRSYRATTTILVGVPTEAAFVQADDITASTDLAPVLVRMIPQEQVLGGVVRQLSLDENWRQLRAGVHAQVVGRSNRLIVVTATAGTADEADAIVRAIPNQLAAAAFPNSAPDDSRAFLWSRVDAVRSHIVATQHLVDELQGRLAGDPRNSARTARRLDDARGLLRRLDGSLSSIYQELQQATSADHVHVLDAPSIAAGPFASEVLIDIAFGIFGALLAVVLANVWSLRSARRTARAATPAAYAS